MNTNPRLQAAKHSIAKNIITNKTNFVPVDDLVDEAVHVGQRVDVGQLLRMLVQIPVDQRLQNTHKSADQE